MSRSVVIRFGALGDTILTTPLLRALRSRHGKACDFVGRGGATPVILKGLPFVGKVRHLRSLKTPYLLSREQRRLVRELNREGYEYLYLLEDGGKSQRLLSRVKEGQLVSAAEVPRGAEEHVVEYQARVAGFELVPTEERNYERAPELALDSGEVADADAWIEKHGWTGRPLSLIQPANRKTRALYGRDSKKVWPLERWAQVARAICDHLPQGRVLVMGTREESFLADGIVEKAQHGRVLSVAGELPLRRLFALFLRAHSLISVDTGPAHAAGALDCPQVVLFGDTDPRLDRPRSHSAPVKTLTAKGNRHEGSMLGISSEEVIEQWRCLAKAIGDFGKP